jgi:ADP-ribosylation factor 2-binding protein
LFRFFRFISDPSFSKVQADFFSKHCHHFTSVDENLLIYTQLFEQYTLLLETLMEKRLKMSIPDFDMATFMQLCEVRGEDQITGDVFDMLVSLGDFETFKTLMVEQKQRAGVNKNKETNSFDLITWI